MRPIIPATRFIVLALYRSGSTLLREALHAHSRVSCQDELYNVSELARFPGILEAPVAVAKGALTRSRGQLVDAVGFKLMYEQATEMDLALETWGPNLPPQGRRDIQAVATYIQADRAVYLRRLAGVWDYLQRDHQLRVIHLRRRNQLEAFVSFQLALREENWVGSTYASRHIHLDPDACRRWCERGRRLERRYSETFAHHPVLDAEYEDLCQDFAGTMARVFAFLGVQAERVAPTTPKQRTEDLDVLVENYRELQRTVRGV